MAALSPPCAAELCQPCGTDATGVKGWLSVGEERRGAESQAVVGRAGEQRSHINRFPLKLANRDVYVRKCCVKAKATKVKMCTREYVAHTVYVTMFTITSKHAPAHSSSLAASWNSSNWDLLYEAKVN